MSSSFRFDPTPASIDAAIERISKELERRGVPEATRAQVRLQARSALRLGETGIIEALVGEDWQSGSSAVDALAAQIAGQIPADQLSPSAHDRERAAREHAQRIQARKAASGEYLV